MRIDYETARKIKDMLETKTYKEIEEEFGVSSRTIAKISKMSDAEIEELKKERDDLGDDKSLTVKARRALLKELANIITEQSLENLKDIVSSGQFLHAYYDEVQRKNLIRLIQKLKNKEVKEHVTKALLLMFLKGELDREDFLKRFMVISYA
jgi:hypothetical protein